MLCPGASPGLLEVGLPRTVHCAALPTLAPVSPASCLAPQPFAPFLQMSVIWGPGFQGRLPYLIWDSSRLDLTCSGVLHVPCRCSPGYGTFRAPGCLPWETWQGDGG